MKDSTAPIKRSEALIQFSREHHFGLLLVWKIRQGLKNNIEAGRIGNYTVFSFENELTEHFKEEEKDLFGKLSVEDPLRRQAFGEHEHIYELVASLRNGPVNATLLKEFADALDSHIRFEERTLFNHLQQHLSAGELKELENSHSKREGDVDDKWEDHFWVIK